MKALKQIELNMDDIDALLERIESKSLLDGDYEIIKAMTETIVCLNQALEQKDISIKRLLKRLFGVKTEKREKVLKETEKNTSSSSKDGTDEPVDDKNQSDSHENGAESPADQNSSPTSKGHGRNGIAAFTGATEEYIEHPTIKHGQRCPLCLKGKIYKVKMPSVTIKFSGSSPLQATIYKLEKLRCNLCGAIFTAKAPNNISGIRHYDASAKAAIPVFKYGCGMPFYRISTIQEMVGVPLSPSTLWEKTEELADVIFPVYNELTKRAAQGKVIHNDDTTMPVLSLINENEEKNPGERTGMFTTGIVSILDDGTTIALFYTGRNHAGENLDTLQQLRDHEKEPFIQMCDAAGRNTNEMFQRIVAHCLVHGRRNFVDIIPAFPEECEYVIDTLAEVYKNDGITKDPAMSDDQRLAYHQEHSAPLMEELHDWLNQQINDKLVEPNSSLGKAICYMLKYWKELTVFLRVPGAPLDNNICEQALKKAILNRKNALFYKNEHGAFIGDMFMGMIHTCKLMQVNPMEYLEALQVYKSYLREDPSGWMPWNFKETIASIENTIN